MVHLGDSCVRILGMLGAYNQSGACKGCTALSNASPSYGFQGLHPGCIIASSSLEYFASSGPRIRVLDLDTLPVGHSVYDIRNHGRTQPRSVCALPLS